MCVHHPPREKDNKLKCPSCSGDLLKDGIERICKICKKHFSLATGKLLEVEYKSPHSYLKCPYSEIVAKQGMEDTACSGYDRTKAVGR